MNRSLKPFRLINNSELKYLQQFFAKSIHIWNESYAMHPLSCKLTQNPKHHDVISTLWCIADVNGPIALCNQKDHNVIKQGVFGKQSDCFNAVSESLFLSLLNRLFGTQSLQWQTTPNRDEYCYTGSPGLTLTLACDALSTTLYLHPQWVVNALPSERITATPVYSMDEALSSHVLPLSVELSPVPLQLLNLVHLNVGDVIKTDHPITKPLLLKHDEATICNVDIGEQFIQISRTL